MSRKDAAGYRAPTSRLLLDRALRRALAGRRPVPCVGVLRDRWTSDSSDDRAFAAAECKRCSVIEECHAAAECNAESWGVWAGIDRGAGR